MHSTSGAIGPLSPATLVAEQEGMEAGREREREGRGHRRRREPILRNDYMASVRVTRSSILLLSFLSRVSRSLPRKQQSLLPFGSQLRSLSPSIAVLSPQLMEESG